MGQWLAYSLDSAPKKTTFLSTARVAMIQTFDDKRIEIRLEAGGLITVDCSENAEVIASEILAGDFDHVLKKGLGVVEGVSYQSASESGRQFEG